MKKQGLETRRWWALVRGPRELPVIFAQREDAEQDKGSDEYLVQVTVRACHPNDQIPKWAHGVSPGELRRVAEALECSAEHGKGRR